MQLNSVSPPLEGRYSCRSQQSNLFTTFILSTGNNKTMLKFLTFTSKLTFVCFLENPFIRAVSPIQSIATEGDSVTLTFLAAVDSDGSSWNNKIVTFSFTNRKGVAFPLQSNFEDSNPQFPQHFEYIIPRVDISHAGTYTASAPRK